MDRRIFIWPNKSLMSIGLSEEPNKALRKQIKRRSKCQVRKKSLRRYLDYYSHPTTSSASTSRSDWAMLGVVWISDDSNVLLWIGWGSDSCSADSASPSKAVRPIRRSRYLGSRYSKFVRAQCYHHCKLIQSQLHYLCLIARYPE